MLKNFSFWVCALFWLVLDQVSKGAIAQNSNLQDLAIWQGVFHLRYITNSGAAFSLFSGGSGWLKWVSLLVSLALVILGIRNSKLNKWEQFGYGCILGGALGNGIDRFRTGAVIDFLDFRLINFPVFNFADIAINVGLAFLLFNILQQSKQSRPSDR
jgi:signal peptidase II